MKGGVSLYDITQTGRHVNTVIVMSSSSVKSKKNGRFVSGCENSRRENVASARKEVTCLSRIESTRHDHSYFNATAHSDAYTTPEEASCPWSSSDEGRRVVELCNDPFCNNNPFCNKN
jgi:hypothetical protein